MRLRRPAAALAALLVLSTVADAETKETPLTKSEERAKFHPDAAAVPVAARLRGWEERVAREKASPLAGLKFRNVGPELQGGRIVAIGFPAGQPDTLLVAYASGGLFRSDNRGGSWTPLFDDQSAMTIGAFALGDPDGRVIWVGTGEANSSRTSYAGTGIFKSTDGGKSWTNTGLHDSHHVGKIVVDAKDPDTVWVAAMGPLYTTGGDRGIYRTTDGGRSWTRTLYVDARTGAIDVVQDTARPDVLYAATWERDRKAWNFLESGSGSGVWKSTDRGTTWKRLGGGFPQGDAVGRIGLALSRAKPDRVYAVVDDQARRPAGEAPDEEVPPGELTPRRLKALSAEQFTKLDPAVVQRFLAANDFPKKLKAKALIRDVKAGKVTIADLVAYVKDANRDLFETPIEGSEVWRSDDGGATWRKPHARRLEKIYYSYGYYFGNVFVAPDDADRVYFGGVPMLMSTDGGATWKGIDRQGVHVDYHALSFGPGNSKHVAMGSDGGLYLSFDAGLTWTKMNNLPVGQFTAIAVDDADPYNVVGGLQDNGTMRGPSNYVAGAMDPAAWRTIGGGDGSMVQVDPKDRNVVYTAFQFGFAQRQNLKTGDRTRVRPRPELKEGPLRYNWVTPFLLSPHSREILWYGANRLYRSFDRGDTFTAVSPDLTSNREQGDVPWGTATAIAESPKTFGVVWVGTDEGKVWRTKDAGASWTEVSKGLAKDRWVTRVVASSFDEGTVYVTQSGYRNDDWNAYVFRSTDFGATWTSLAKGLPAEPVNVIREDPKAKHLLYLGTDTGAWASLDRGESWTPLTGGLPHVAVHDLAVQPREGDLVLGTHGRSMFVAEAAPLRKLTDEVRTKELVAFPVKSVPWDRRRGYGEHPWITWRHVPPVSRVAWWASPPAAGPATVVVKDAYGNVWKEASAVSVAGLNVFEYDLTADPARADAAEADLRRRLEEKAKAQEEIDQRFSSKEKKEGPEGERREDEPDDGDGSDASAGAPASKPVPPDLVAALADPYHSTRTRYLPPGTYTVEIASAGKTATTKLEVKKPKVESLPDDED